MYSMKTIKNNPELKFYFSQFFNSMIKAEASFLAERLKKEGNIIDVGCGSGLLEQKLNKFDIVGIQDSNELLSLARKKSKNLFVKGSAENLPFLKEEFKIGIINLSVKYIKNWKRAISELSSVISNDGDLFAFFVNPDIEIKHLKAFKNGDISNNINLDDLEDYISKFFRIVEFYPLKFKNNKKEIIITALWSSRNS